MAVETTVPMKHSLVMIWQKEVKTMGLGDRTHFLLQKYAICGHIIRLTYNLRLTKTVKEYIMFKNSGEWGFATTAFPD